MLFRSAQHEIFSGFWKSFTSAFVVIGIVMAISLRSIRIMLLAMIPNLLPLGVVFGMLGWLGMPVDIGMMMTGSIALGISIDGTFHFLVRYLEQCEEGRANAHAVCVALLTTGGPIFESIVVSSIGMLALTLSSFAPTVRFGLLMATLLMATLAGDLLLLPALLSFWVDRLVARRQVALLSARAVPFEPKPRRSRVAGARAGSRHGGSDAAARLWDLRNGLPLGEPAEFDGAVMDAEFSADGQRLLVACSDGTAHIVPLPPLLARAPDWLAPLAEALVSQRFDAHGATAIVSPVELWEVCETIRRAPKDDPAVRWVRDLLDL